MQADTAGLMMRAMDWLKHHEYIAAWMGAIVTVITLASRFTKPSVSGNRVSVIVLFFVFALEATIALSPTAGVITRILAAITACVSLSGSFVAWYEAK